MSLLRLAVFFSLLCICWSCSCLPTHPQGHFCRAHFVVRGKILSGPVQVLPDTDRIPIGIPRDFLANQVYTLRVTKIYKGSSEIRSSGGLRRYGRRKRSYIVKIFTPSKRNSCSVDFSVGKVYVMSGYIGRKKLSVSGCDFKKEWSQITKKQRSGFARKYYGNCECSHAICYGDGCKNTKLRKKACAFDMAPTPENECRDKYQFCRISYNGRRCEWTKNHEYKKCMKRIP